MPALFNLLVCHKTPRPPQRPRAAPRQIPRPFSPIVFADFSDSETDDFTSDDSTSDDSESEDNHPSPPRSRRASFSISPADDSPGDQLLEATYQAPSHSDLGDPIIAPPSLDHPHLAHASSAIAQPSSTHSTMPKVLQPTPASRQAWQGRGPCTI
ncbi:hypothetical protein BC629DRAFT_1725637 [Irpex lacteus]|nr:hypothetical protein BC629DRAFT_1725637 [Irpex lacteus]